MPLEHYKNIKKYSAKIKDVLQRKAHRWEERDISIFTTAAIRDTILATMLFNVFELLSCARVSIPSFHCAFAKFFWKVDTEPMRRDNLFRCLNVGGLGLMHLFVKQMVLSFMFWHDQRNHFSRSRLDFSGGLFASVHCKLVFFIPNQTCTILKRNRRFVSVFNGEVLDKVYWECNEDEIVPDSSRATLPTPVIQKPPR